MKIFTTKLLFIQQSFSVVGLTLIFTLIFTSSFSQTPVRFYSHAKAGYKNPVTGAVIVEPNYDAGSDFREGFAIVMTGRKRGYINEKGEVAIALQYDDARNFAEGLAAVKKDGHWGFVDPKGTLTIPLQYTDAFFFHDGIARVSDGTKGFYIDKNNKWVKDEEKHQEEWETQQK